MTGSEWSQAPRGKNPELDLVVFQTAWYLKMTSVKLALPR